MSAPMNRRSGPLGRGRRNSMPGRTPGSTPRSGPLAAGSAGFTVVELLIAALVGTILMGAVVQVLVSNQRISIVHREQVTGHQTVRAGVDLLGQELREVSAGGGDLLTMEAQRVAFRALRAQGVACEVGVGGGTTLRVAVMTRPFEENENLYVFADDDPERTDDDAWFSTQVQAVSGGEACGVDGIRAQDLTISGLSQAQMDRIRVGAQVRSWEEVEYEVRSVDGDPYLVRVQNGTGARLVGPLAGLTFTYLDAAGNATATATQVATVRIALRTASSATNPLGQQVADSLATIVHLRN